MTFWNSLLLTCFVYISCYPVGAVLSSQQDIIQRLNYGVVFRPDSKLLIAQESWLHTFEIVLPRDFTIADPDLCSYDANQSQICLTGNNIVHFINHLHLSMSHDLKQTIKSIRTLVPQTNIFKSKNKRSLLPFIGTLAKGLFGTATMSDVELLAKHVNALNAQSRHLTQALQQHGDHLSSFVKVVDKRTSFLMQGIKNNALEIQTITKSFNKSLGSLEQSMVNSF